MSDTELMDDEERAFVEAVERAEKGESVKPPEPDTPEPEKLTAQQDSEQPQNPPTEAGSSSQDDAFDASALPETVQAKIRELEDRARKLENERNAAINQNRPTQRKVAELQMEINQLRNHAPPRSAPPATPTPKESAESSESVDFDSQEWKEFERDYPGAAKRFRETQSRREQEIVQLRTALDSRLSTVDQFIQTQQLQHEISELDREHPDWREKVEGGEQMVLNSPDGMQVSVNRDFGEWLLSQHPNVQSLFSSKRGSDNAYLVSLYKTTRPASSPQPTPRPRPKPPEADPSPRQQVAPPGHRAGSSDPEELAYLEALARSGL